MSKQFRKIKAMAQAMSEEEVDAMVATKSQGRGLTLRRLKQTLDALLARKRSQQSHSAPGDR